ncbi:MAG: alkylhydroperoxidase family enzyme, partial [Alphaproteobacteria bacterium]
MFSPAERAALALAEAMTVTPADISDDLFAEL